RSARTAEKCSSSMEASRIGDEGGAVTQWDPETLVAAGLSLCEEIRHDRIEELLGSRTHQDRIDAPNTLLVVWRVAVFLKGLLGLEDLVDKEEVRSVRVAQHVEAKVARLLPRADIVDAESRQELVDTVGLDFDPHHLNKHSRPFF